MTEPFRRRRLPFKVSYRGLELSGETEELLDEAMVRLDIDDPDEAVKAALPVFLKQDQRSGELPSIQS
jgi:hypothetical protein